MSALPRISLLLEMVQSAMRVSSALRRGATPEELAGLADAIGAIAAVAEAMECRLDATDAKPIPEADNVVSFADFAKPTQPRT